MKTPATLAATLVRVIHRHFIWVIISSYAVAALLPEFGLWIREVSFGSGMFQHGKQWPMPLLLLALLLFNAGMGVKTEELGNLLRAPQVLLYGVFGNLAVPLALIIVISFALKLWHNQEEVQQILVGLALIASMPIAGASTAWTQNVDGNLSLSLGLVLFTTLSSPLLTPFTLHTVGFMATGDYAEDLHELASGGVVSFLGLWVVLPSLLGIAMRRSIGERRAAQSQPFVKLANYFVLVLLNYSNASLTLPKTLANPDLDFMAIMLAVVIVLCVVAFSSGYALGRFMRVGRDELASLMFGLGMNNNGTGLVLASTALADHPQVMLPIIFYNLVQHLVASTVDFSMFRRQPS